MNSHNRPDWARHTFFNILTMLTLPALSEAALLAFWRLMPGLGWGARLVLGLPASVLFILTFRHVFRIVRGPGVARRVGTDSARSGRGWDVLDAAVTLSYYALGLICVGPWLLGAVLPAHLGPWPTTSVLFLIFCEGVLVSPAVEIILGEWSHSGPEARRRGGAAAALGLLSSVLLFLFVGVMTSVANLVWLSPLTALLGGASSVALTVMAQQTRAEFGRQ